MLNKRFKTALLCAAVIAAPAPVTMVEAAGLDTLPQGTSQAASHHAIFSQEKAGFSLQFKGLTSPYKRMATYVMPNEALHLAVTGAAGDYRIDAGAGQVQQTAAGQWIWHAPAKTGLYPVTVRRAGTNDAMTLNVFVMVPYSHMKHGAINGYRIGHYPDKAPVHAKVYQKPRGFIEVTRENQDTYIAPHFQLKQFLCKEAGGYPKYVVLQEKLLLKLELLLAKANEQGYRANTFTVMSGYRTPAYNAGLGNVKFSAHQFGMAADVYIDSSHNGVMDDLNHDGSVDYHDAATLYRMADQLHVEPGTPSLIGGLGKYKATRAHGPFVHVDVRGYKARWARL